MKDNNPYANILEYEQNKIRQNLLHGPTPIGSYSPLSGRKGSEPMLK